METSEAQERIFAALKARRYTEGLTAEQLTARQVAKMLEEVCELAEHVKGFSGHTRYLIQSLHARARVDFDYLEQWQRVGGITSFAGLKAELPDVAVTLANTAEALTWNEECTFDVMAEAVRKAEADVVRGVRNGGNHDGQTPA